MKTIYVATDPDRSYTSRARSGAVAKVEVVPYIEQGVVHINGLGPKDKDLGGGLRCTPEAMDELAHRWIAAREHDGDTPLAIGPADAQILLRLVETLGAHLVETHQEELASDHFSDPADTCSYCQTLREARELLRSHDIEPPY